MVKNYLDIANDLKRARDLIPVDYWNLQAYMHLQRMLDILDALGPITIKSLKNKLDKAKIFSSKAYKSSNNYMQIYQNIVALFSAPEFSSQSLSLKDRAQVQMISRAFFEADSVGIEVLRVLEEVNNSYGDDKVKETKGTADFHQKLLERYTVVKNAVVNNPDSGMEELKSIMGIGFDTIAHGRIPYRYPFSPEANNGRQVPISLGCPVIHNRFSKTMLNPIFSAYVDSNLDPTSNYLDHLDYLYINLQRHHDGYMPQVKSEFVRSEELHRSLNKKDGAAAVSLPAYSPYFNQGMDTHTCKADTSLETLDNMFKGIVDSIINSSNDFVIPDKVLILMYKNMLGGELPSGFNLRSKINVEKLIKHRYEEAIEIITGEPGYNIRYSKVDAETRMAVMSYFVKATLTEQILETTNPKRYNITCKDAIDRAGTHNLILGIHRKVKAGEKINIDDVKRCLDGLAMAYKHRPMNHQATVFFNTFEKLYYSMSIRKREIIFPADSSGRPWPSKWLDESSPVRPSICFKNTGEIKEKIKTSGLKSWWKRKTSSSYVGKLGDYNVECSSGVIRLYLHNDARLSDLYPPKRERTIQQIIKSLPSEVNLQEVANIPRIKKRKLKGSEGRTEVEAHEGLFSRSRQGHDEVTHESRNISMMQRHSVMRGGEAADADLPTDIPMKSLKERMREANSLVRFIRTESIHGEDREAVMLGARQSLFIVHRKKELSSVHISTASVNPVEEDIKAFAECIIASNCKQPKINGGNTKDILQVLKYLKEKEYRCEPIVSSSVMENGTIAERAQIRGLIKNLCHQGQRNGATLGIGSRDR